MKDQESHPDADASTNASTTVTHSTIRWFAWKRSLVVRCALATLPVLFFMIFVLPKVEGNRTAFIGLGVFFAFVALLLALPTIMLAVAIRSASRPGMGLAKFAHRVNGELISQKMTFLGIMLPRAVRFSHRTAPCIVNVETEGTGRNCITFTRLSFELPRPATFTCHVLPQGTLSQVAAWFGSQDVRLGWEFFDDQFVVTANDDLRAPQILDKSIQDLLLELKSFTNRSQPPNMARPGHVELAVDSTHLRLRIRGHLEDEEQLLHFFEAGSRVFDLLEPRVTHL